MLYTVNPETVDDPDFKCKVYAIYRSTCWLWKLLFLIALLFVQFNFFLNNFMYISIASSCISEEEMINMYIIEKD